MKSQKTNWWLDAILFIGFISTFLLDLTGMELHQWIGIAIPVCCLVHLAVHWNCVKKVVSRFFGKTTWAARVNLIIDGMLVGGFMLITLTGLIISTWLNLTFITYDLWRTIHILVSVSTLALVLLKIVLHRKWIVNVGEKYVFKNHDRNINPLPAQFQPTKAQTSRREFLKIGGLVGAASLVGLTQVVKLVQAGFEEEEIVLAASSSAEASSIGPVPKSVSQPAIEPLAQNHETAMEPIQVIPTQVPTVQQEERACVIRCNKGCSFPGRCRKYVDANGNDLCDLGECL